MEVIGGFVFVCFFVLVVCCDGVVGVGFDLVEGCF